MIGDGYKTVAHCEFVDVPEDIEPDADPIYCTLDEDEILTKYQGWWKGT